MKQLFCEYYQPSIQEFAALWANAIIVVDANVLLNLYTYSEPTTNEVLALLSEYADRLWLSHQAATEYQENRRGTISKEAKRYSEISRALDSVCCSLRSKKQHPYIDANLSKRLDAIEKEVKQALSTGENRLRKSISTSEDSICKIVTNLFDNRVGNPFESERLSKIYKEGAERYAQKIPPGYCDEKKPEPNRYGDLLVWMQVMDYSKAQGKSVIFVTDDATEDWWDYLEQNKTGPKRALRKEFRQFTENDIYIYSTDGFMEAATAHGTKMSLSIEAVREIKDASKERAETVSIIEAIESNLVSSFANAARDPAVAAVAKQDDLSVAFAREFARHLSKPPIETVGRHESIADQIAKASAYPVSIADQIAKAALHPALEAIERRHQNIIDQATKEESFYHALRAHESIADQIAKAFSNPAIEASERHQRMADLIAKAVSVDQARSPVAVNEQES